MTVKGFLLKDRKDEEYLLAIQSATQGLFERLIVLKRSMGVGSNSTGTGRVPGNRVPRPSQPYWRISNACESPIPLSY